MTHAPTVILSRTAAALAGLGRRIEIPQRIGSVVLLKPLGEGGMSVVHLGRHEIFQKNVAVKFLLDVPGSADDPRFTTFLEGARAAAAIKHPGLNLVYHADSIEGVPYLVMELIEGPTLADLLHKHGPLPPHIARAVIESVCDAVGELHANSIVHRDIKPANVMIDPAGRIVVTDFGLALQRPAAVFGGPSSDAGIAGTPAYMAPEMFDANISTRTDVYALGVNMCELLTGKPPFDADFQGLRLAHRTAPVPVGKLAAAGVPENVIVVIERAMHKDVLFRPKSARHVLDAFSKACDAAGIARATAAQIQRFIEVGRAADSSAIPQSTPAPAYYDRLNTLADLKRRTPDSGFPDNDQPPTPPESEPTPVIQPPTADPPAVDSPRAGPSTSPRSARALDPRVAIPLFVIGTSIVLSLTSFLGAAVRHAVLRAFGVPAAATDVPMLPGIAASICQLAVFLAVPLAFAWWLYIRAVLAPARRDAVTRCGWCASPLLRLRDLRCPECGRFFAAAAPTRERPPAHRWSVRLAHYGVTAAAFSITLAAFAPFYLRAISSWFPTRPFPFTFPSILAMAGLVLPAVAVSIGVLHSIARATAPLNGRTRCGRCGADLAGITTPQCAACGHRI